MRFAYNEDRVICTFFDSDIKIGYFVLKSYKNIGILSIGERKKL